MAEVRTLTSARRSGVRTTPWTRPLSPPQKQKQAAARCRIEQVEVTSRPRTAFSAHTTLGPGAISVSRVTPTKQASLSPEEVVTTVRWDKRTQKGPWRERQAQTARVWPAHILDTIDVLMRRNLASSRRSAFKRMTYIRKMGRTADKRQKRLREAKRITGLAAGRRQRSAAREDTTKATGRRSAQEDGSAAMSTQLRVLADDCVDEG